MWIAKCTIGALALLLAASCTATPTDRDTSPFVRAPDHIMIWSQEPQLARRTWETLGFQVRESQTYPEGISSSTIVFSDWSYLELLYFSAPERAGGSARAQAELAFARQGPGSNSFAVQVSDVDAAHSLLRQRDFSVAEIERDMGDPDGPGGPAPAEPASWRDFHFASWPTPGVDLFFIEYPPDEASSPDAERATHHNSARRLSAVWILVDDLDDAADAYRRMTFSVGPVVEVAHLNAQARVALLSGSAVVLVQSDQLPEQFVSTRAGSGIIGLSIEVTDLTNVAQHTDSGSTEVEGLFGPTRLFPLAQHIGLFVEFHEGR
jgi:Glyoxalase-like domain